MVMKPNLYSILDMIPDRHERVNPTAKTELKKVLYIMNYVKNGPKWLENVKTTGKGVKIFRYLKHFYKY